MPSPPSDSVRRTVPFFVVGTAFLLAAQLLAPRLYAAEDARAVEDAAEYPWLAGSFAADGAEMMEAARGLEAPEDSDLYVLLAESHFRFDAEGRFFYRSRYINLLLTPSGAESRAARVGASWDPWHQDRPEIRARVIDPSGKEHWLDPKTLVEEPVSLGSDDLWSDRRVLSGPLPAIGAGAIIEKEIRVDDTEPLFSAGTTWAQGLTAPNPSLYRRVVLEAPASLPLRINTHGIDGLEPRREEVDGFIRYTWELRNHPGAETPEPSLPPAVARYPTMAFSIGESWNAVASAYSEVVDQQLDGADLSELYSPPVEAEAIADRAQEYLDRIHATIRYTGLLLGASSIVPTTPQDILARRYGDCKDQASLLVGLLREDGIPAHVALLRTGPDWDVDPSLPGLGRFDHATAVIEGDTATGRDPIWIDPTDPDSPVGDLPLADQGRLALIAAPETEDLVMIPVAPAEANRDLERREVFLPPFGNGRIVETTTYFGSIGAQNRGRLRYSSAEDRRESYGDYIESLYEATLGELNEAPGGAGEPFRLELEALDAEVAVVDLTEAVVTIPRGTVFSRTPDELVAAREEDADPRQNPFETWEPFVSERHYVIHPPPGMAVRELPPASERTLGATRYEHRFWLDDGLVHGLLRFDSGPRTLTAQEFEDTRTELLEVFEEPTLLVWFDASGRPALRDGRAVEAVELQREQIKTTPSEPVFRLRYAQLLLELGLGAEARRQAESAAEMGDDAFAEYFLGNTLLHDEMGRVHGGGAFGGWDRDGAEAALERALELDPEHTASLLELAILQEFDHEGRRYQDPEAIRRAAELYEKWLETESSPEIGNNYLIALLRSGRFADLAEEAQARTDVEGWSVFLVLARAVEDGVQDALVELQNLSVDEAQTTEILVTAAQLALSVREYETAVELIDQASRRSSEPAQFIGATALFRKLRRHEEIERDLTQPSAVGLAVLHSLLSPEKGIESLKALFHPRYHDEVAGEVDNLSDLRDEVTSGDEGATLDFLLDFVLATLDAEVEGEREVGWRLELSSDIEDSLRLTLYLVEHKDRPVIVADSEEGSTIGDQIRLFLNADRTDLARTWLDWARREVKPSGEEDPLPKSPFLSWWPEDSTAMSPEAMELASFLLAVEVGVDRGDLKSPQSRRRVEEAVAFFDAAASEADTDEKRLLDIALLRAYRLLDRHDEQARLATQLLDLEPSSRFAHVLAAEALSQLGDWEGLESLLSKRLERIPGHSRTQVQLAAAAASRGEFKLAIERLEKADPDATTLNQIAWYRLLAGEDPADVVSAAERAAQLDQFEDPAILHTLAAVYAWADRPYDAGRVLSQVVGSRENSEPSAADWAVHGRILESYGLLDQARTVYERVEEPKPDTAESIYHLVQDRLRELAPERTG